MSRAKLYLGNGLGNRINAYASGLASRKPLEIIWSNDLHCPMPFDEVFARHPRVHAVEEVSRAPRTWKKSGTELYWYYPYNMTDLPFEEFRHRLQRSYAFVLEGLFAKVQRRMLPGGCIGVQVRQHFPWYDRSGLGPIVRQASYLSKTQGSGHVWLMCDIDSIKHGLAQQFEENGVQCCFLDYPGLKHDLDRASSIQAYIQDLSCLAQCATFVVNTSCSTVTDPFLVRGDSIHCMFDDDQIRRQDWPDYYRFRNLFIHQKSVLRLSPSMKMYLGNPTNNKPLRKIARRLRAGMHSVQGLWKKLLSGPDYFGL